MKMLAILAYALTLAFSARLMACDRYGTCYDLRKPLDAPEGYEWVQGRYAYMVGSDAYGRRWELKSKDFRLGPADVCYDEDRPTCSPNGWEWLRGTYWNYDAYSSKCRRAERWELRLRLMSEPKIWEGWD